MKSNCNLKIEGANLGILTANFELTKQTMLSLDLSNGIGEKIKSVINNRSMQSGVYKIALDELNIKAGLYFLTLRSNVMVLKTVKFIIL